MVVLVPRFLYGTIAIGLAVSVFTTQAISRVLTMALSAEFFSLLVVFAIAYVFTTILMVRHFGKLGWQSEARKAFEDLTAAVERLTIAMDGVHFVVEEDGRLHAHPERR